METVGDLEVMRLVDGYMRREQWVAKMRAVEIGRVVATMMGGEADTGAGARGTQGRRRVGAGELLRATGQTI